MIDLWAQTATDTTLRLLGRTTRRRFCDGALDRHAEVSAVSINFPRVLLRIDAEMDETAEPQPADPRDVAWSI